MEFNPEVKEVIQREFISALQAEGLVLVPDFVGNHVKDFYEKRQQLLRKKYVTPYQIAKYGLLPGVKSIKTVKAMLTDGRIAATEWFLDKQGKKQVLTMAIKRINA